MLRQTLLSLTCVAATLLARALPAQIQRSLVGTEVAITSQIAPEIVLPGPALPMPLPVVYLLSLHGLTLEQLFAQPSPSHNNRWSIGWSESNGTNFDEGELTVAIVDGTLIVEYWSGTRVDNVVTLVNWSIVIGSGWTDLFAGVIRDTDLGGNRHRIQSESISYYSVRNPL